MNIRILGGRNVHSIVDNYCIIFELTFFSYFCISSVASQTCSISKAPLSDINNAVFTDTETTA